MIHYTLKSKVEDQEQLNKLLENKLTMEVTLMDPKEVLHVEEHYYILRHTTDYGTSYTHIMNIEHENALPPEEVKAWINQFEYVSKVCDYPKVVK